MNTLTFSIRNEDGWYVSQPWSSDGELHAIHTIRSKAFPEKRKLRVAASLDGTNYTGFIEYETGIDFIYEINVPEGIYLKFYSESEVTSCNIS